MNELEKIREKLANFDLNKEDRNELNLIADEVMWVCKEDLQKSDEDRELKDRKYELLSEYIKMSKPARDGFVDYEAHLMAAHIKEIIVKFLDEYIKLN